MSDLSQKRCLPCEGGVAPLTAEQISLFMTDLNDWQVSSASNAISRTFKFKDFHQTMDFVNKIAEMANEENHHPDLEVSYNRCTVHYTTHAIGGLSENDFICASKVDHLTL